MKISQLNYILYHLHSVCKCITVLLSYLSVKDQKLFQSAKFHIPLEQAIRCLQLAVQHLDEVKWMSSTILLAKCTFQIHN